MRRRPLRAALLVAVVLAAASTAAAQNRPAVIVTPGSSKTFRAALQRFADRSPQADTGRAEAFRQAIADALVFSDVFQVLDREAFLAPAVTLSLEDGAPLVCSDWTQIGADAFIEGELEFGASELSAAFHVWDVGRCRRVVRKRYRQPVTADPDRVAKRIADDVVEAFIGIRGAAATEIAFASTRNGHREIYVMDADGANQRAATANRSINTFPSWSPDGDSILYTSYRSQNRPLLFVTTRSRGSPGRLLQRIGSDAPEYRGVYGPDGRVAVVRSVNGAADLFTVNADGRDLRQITRNRSIDVSPSWSPDGKQIAFVSDRGGAPQVYVMNADGTGVRRLTYQGSYNTAPDWSPDGRWIAYESRLESQFDIWLIDTEGAVNVPIVSHPRSDEGPTWAPNSRKIAFSSRRRGLADIYVVDVGGENLRRITSNAGENTSPSWGPFPR